MAITVICGNPECRQACLVGDDHAGRLVRCPRCPALIQVPLYPAPDQVAAVPGETFDLDLGQFQFGDAGGPPPPPGAAPPPPPEIVSILGGFLRSRGVTAGGAILFAVGLGCCVLLLLFIMLPWKHLARLDHAHADSWLGLITAGGSVSFMLTLLVMGLVCTAVLLRHPVLFEVAVWALPAWGLLSTLWRVSEIVATPGQDAEGRWSAGVGMYLALVASLTLLCAAGFAAVQRAVSKRR